MSALPTSAREVLESAALAHFVTINPDGSPQVSCVWVGLDGDEIVAAHLDHNSARCRTSGVTRAWPSPRPGEPSTV